MDPLCEADSNAVIALIERIESDKGSQDDFTLLSEWVEKMSGISDSVRGHAIDLLRTSSPIIMR